MAMRILLADNNRTLAAALASFMKGLGHDVVLAASGTEAVKQLAAAPVDLLLLELSLPEISGIDILRKLRSSSSRFAKLPVITMTAVYKGEKYAAAARSLGIDQYLEKPFSRELFEAALHSVSERIHLPKPPTLLETLIHIHDNRLSGLLTIGSHSPVSFVKGEPVSFQVSEKGDFPEFLRSRGKIDRREMELFLASGRERIFLVEAGIIPFEELQSESQHFLSLLLFEHLQKSETILFKEGVDTAQPPLFDIYLPRLLYEGVRSHPEQFRADEVIEKYSRSYPARTLKFYRLANFLSMSEPDIALLERINGERQVSELIETAPSPRNGALFIQFLHLSGMVTLADTPTSEALPDFPQQSLFNRPIDDSLRTEELTVDFIDIVEEVAASVTVPMSDFDMAAPLSEKDISFEQAVQREYSQIKDKDYYTIFGITAAKFSFNTLKNAYFSKIREYSPERFMELSGATSEAAQEILALYADAYNTLSNVVAKERYDELLNSEMTMGIDGKQDGKLHARIQFESGQVFLQMGEYENAEKALQDAYTIEPENAAHGAFLAWAIYNNSANSRSKAAMERSRALLVKSLQIDKSAEAFAFRGWMLYDEGRDGLAEGEFLKALKLNHKEPTALKGMGLINAKREIEKKGVFRRLFN